ncbi:MAG: IS3 family transposase, partial [Pseudomonadota bacterium]|nr:IS3 family transposase [Pseudomonadota bacterium]
MVTPAARGGAAAHLVEVHGMSGRRACRAIGADRSSLRYAATQPDDGELRERLREPSRERRRFGYRRLHVLLRREGMAVNRNRAQRIHVEEKRQVRRRGGRKPAPGTRVPMAIPDVPKARGSPEVVQDRTIDGRRFRVPASGDACACAC